jgi:hypothetical protein
MIWYNNKRRAPPSLGARALVYGISIGMGVVSTLAIKYFMTAENEMNLNRQNMASELESKTNLDSKLSETRPSEEYFSVR